MEGYHCGLFFFLWRMYLIKKVYRSHDSHTGFIFFLRQRASSIWFFEERFEKKGGGGVWARKWASWSPSPKNGLSKACSPLSSGALWLLGEVSKKHFLKRLISFFLKNGKRTSGEMQNPATNKKGEKYISSRVKNTITGGADLHISFYERFPDI